MKGYLYLILNVGLSYVLAYQLIYWHHWNAYQNFFYMIGILTIIWSLFFSYQYKKRKDNPWIMCPEIRKYYCNELTKQEMDIFLKQMYEFQQNMLKLEKFFNEELVLNDFNNQYEVLDNLLVIYRYLLHHPKKLLDFNQLLYKQLPSLIIMASKYMEINRHYFKDESSKKYLNNAQQAMRIIMENIQEISLKLQEEGENA